MAGVLSLTPRTVLANAIHNHGTQAAITAAPAVTSATPTPIASQESVEAQAVQDAKRTNRLHGIASWYGKVFHGRKTASGERFNMYALTACHPTLPFGTLVRVVNEENHKSVVVRITDRGDLVDEGRIIDLSFAAASRLSMVHDGLVQVNLEIVKLGHPRHAQ